MDAFLPLLIPFLIAVLTGMGMGSGGLLVVSLTLLWNVPQVSAQGINLLFFLFSSGASLLLHIQKRRLSFFLLLLIASAGVLGSLPGSFVATLLPEVWVRRIFGGMLLVSGGISFLKKSKKTEKSPKKS